MSKLYYYYRPIEVEVDVNDEYVREYNGILPHHDFIGKEMCSSWNDAKMEQYFDGILKNNIKSCKMTFTKMNGNSYAKITIEGMPNYRFSSIRRNEIFDQLDAQMSDGWGEGFFGMINVMTAPDGKKMYVD